MMIFSPVFLQYMSFWHCFSCEKETPKIHIYDGRGTNTPLHVLEKLHYKPVIQIKVFTYEQVA